HLGPKQVAALQYPVVGEKLKKLCIDALRKALDLREKARLEMDKASTEFLQCTGLDKMDLKPADLLRRLSIKRSTILDRLDSEPFAPLYSAYRKSIEANRSHKAI